MSHVTRHTSLLQVSQLRSAHLHAVLFRWRRKSSVVTIMGHALYKTFAIIATSICGSYIIIGSFLAIAVALLPLALLSRMAPHRLPQSLRPIAFTTLLKAVCVFLALSTCFTLPLFIQQGDQDSPNNTDPLRSDAACVFYYTTFNLSAPALFCGPSFYSQFLPSFFAGDYPTIFYKCSMRMSRATLYVLPFLAIINLMTAFYADDFAFKNKLMQQCVGLAALNPHPSTPCHMSHVTCHMSHVTCHMS